MFSSGSSIKINETEILATNFNSKSLLKSEISEMKIENALPTKSRNHSSIWDQGELNGDLKFVKTFSRLKNLSFSALEIQAVEKMDEKLRPGHQIIVKRECTPEKDAIINPILT